jgi:hypothetical protein
MNLNIEVDAFSNGLAIVLFLVLGLGGNRILVCGRVYDDGADGGWGGCGN